MMVWGRRAKDRESVCFPARGRVHAWFDPYTSFVSSWVYLGSKLWILHSCQVFPEVGASLHMCAVTGHNTPFTDTGAHAKHTGVTPKHTPKRVRIQRPTVFVEASKAWSYLSFSCCVSCCNGNKPCVGFTNGSGAPWRSVNLSAALKWCRLNSKM